MATLNFLQRAEASRQRCQVLNPNVELCVDCDDVADKDAEYFKDYDLVILIDQKYSVSEKINRICRDANIRYFRILFMFLRTYVLQICS